LPARCSWHVRQQQTTDPTTISEEICHCPSIARSLPRSRRIGKPSAPASCARGRRNASTTSSSFWTGKFGNLATIYDDLIEDVGIDGKHSFEDTIEDVRELKSIYGDRIALLGGIDVDFLCRASPEAIRQRVRNTLDICMPGGGYCLGTGNSVANYIPLENYLAMVDEGRRYDP
jgi:hypothetical protein